MGSTVCLPSFPFPLHLVYSVKLYQRAGPTIWQSEASTSCSWSWKGSKFSVVPFLLRRERSGWGIPPNPTFLLGTKLTEKYENMQEWDWGAQNDLFPASDEDLMVHIKKWQPLVKYITVLSLVGHLIMTWLSHRTLVTQSYALLRREHCLCLGMAKKLFSIWSNLNCNSQTNGRIWMRFCIFLTSKNRKTVRI